MTRALLGFLFLFPMSDMASAADEVPIIHYGGSRSSSDWVSMPNGLRVAVGKGVAWQGVKVYLSLTWNLVGVDSTTGKALFGTSVGAFWNTITFKEVTPTDGAKQWAIELRPGLNRRRTAGADMRQYHALRTGKKLDVPDLAKTPSGKQFEPRIHIQGDNSDIAEKFGLLVSTSDNWTALQARMFPASDSKERLAPIDFEKEVVVVLSSGNSSNGRGIGFSAAYEDDTRILLRVTRSSFQTMNGFQKCRPWGIFVLPRQPGKTYEIERNHQGLIGGPPLWKQIYKFAQIGPAESELAKLPAKSKTPHHGWSEDLGRSNRPQPPAHKRPK